MTTFDSGVSSSAGEPDAKPAPGAMTLTEHLRELRSRLFKSALAIVVGMVVAWIFYDPIYAFLSEPITKVIEQAQSEGRDIQVVVLGVTDPFTLKLKVSAMAGLVLSGPVWLYQLWRFVTPGLHKNERRTAYLFVGFGFPLFLAGIAMAYLVLPKGLDLLFGFTPENVGNYVEVSKYLTFFLRTALVFGLGFLLPLVLVALNVVGILSGKRLLSWWRGIIFGVFLFAAVATPSGDPITMFVLALPMLILVGSAIGFSFLNDRRRARRGSEPDYDTWGDDETSPIAEE
ncbi:MAG: twin-arginine translocase subunit TatC [Actinobacteria bacterium]|nr:twin-arginine translocase subunit TatC [Actinomycetota bacterium]MCB9412534.1 twin-arginine translocase subunit TatC [Actinomycetota bacterium]